MKIKTSKLTGAALDWAVAKCEDGKVSITDERGGWLVVFQPRTRGATGGGSPFPPMFFSPSTKWAQGGPIIERERIDITFMDGDEVDTWHVSGAHGRDKSPLVSAMRCYVALKLGDEIEIPKELT